MTEQQRRENARQFYYHWKDRGSERREAKQFWSDLLGSVLGMENLNDIEYEKQVHKERSKGAIDVYIKDTNILIEQKSAHISLDKKERKPDGTYKTPYEQARSYEWHLPRSEKPRFIITCNFREFRIYNMESPHAEPIRLLLEDLPDHYHILNFIVNPKELKVNKELQVSVRAGEIVGILYDELLKQYVDPTDPEVLFSLNALCVRIVFCLYAEDAGVFGHKRMFHDYMEQYKNKGFRDALKNLFIVLDEKEEERSPYLDPDLKVFPYVNGGLFDKNINIDIPRFNDKIIDIILNQASGDFDWSSISPTIFGAVFESTLNPETRRSGGMHYTSIVNIHKVIKPLFLRELHVELKVIKQMPVLRSKIEKLNKFHDKLASLNFLDPACGSGNFLTESYICIRRLENEVIKEKESGQMILGEVRNPIKVSIGQFYGIEINDFAVTVARTALWIAESQMMKETEDIILQQLDFLPLKSSANIVEGNALVIEWNDVIHKSNLNYIMGNPPFVGYAYQSKIQKEDMMLIFPKAKNLDYVAAWYKKSLDVMGGTKIRAALVSTNSITQGEQVTALWRPLIKSGININFAHRTFKWSSEATNKAGVHCVIIGFSLSHVEEKIIYDSDEIIVAKNINPYLIDAPNVFIDKRQKPLCDVPEMSRGSDPVDGGQLIINADEYDNFISKEPSAKKYIKQYMMGNEFLNNKKRYCLWLVDVIPSELRKMPLVMERIEKCYQMRSSSKRSNTLKAADTPFLFESNRQPKTEYIALAKVSSERRRYIPIGYLSKDVIAGDKLFTIPDATLYHFAILNSNVHNAWMRVVSGRLEMRYSYSNTIVYNNFPWPSPSLELKVKIEQTAQGILNARALYPDSSLADLYDPLTMPPELRKAHAENDKTIMRAYGFNIKEMNESDCVAKLMEMYQELIQRR